MHFFFRAAEVGYESEDEEADYTKMDLVIYLQLQTLNIKRLFFQKLWSIFADERREAINS